MQRRKQITSRLVWVAVEKGGPTFLQILTTAVLARLLEPEDFGLMAATAVAVGVASIFAQIGVGPAVVQMARLSEVHLRTAASLAAVLGLLCMLVLWSSSPIVATLLDLPNLVDLLRTSSLVFIFSGLSVVPEALLLRRFHFKRLAHVSLAAFLMGYAPTAIGLAVLGWGPWSLVFGQLLQAVVRLLLLYLHSPSRCGFGFNSGAAKDFVKFGGSYTLGRVFSLVAVETDKVVIARVFGAGDLGFYSRSQQLGVLPASLIGQTVDRLLFPTMAREQENRMQLSSRFLRTSELLATVVIPISIFACILAPEVVRIVLGPGWEKSVVLLQILLLGMTFRVGYRVSDSLAKAVGQLNGRAWRNCVYALLSIIAALTGSRWGIGGVAIGVNVALFLNYVLAASQSLAITRVSWRDYTKAHIPGLVLGALAFLVVQVMVVQLRAFQLHDINVLVVGIAVAVALFAILIPAMSDKCALKSSSLSTLRELVMLAWYGAATALEKGLRSKRE